MILPTDLRIGNTIFYNAKTYTVSDLRKDEITIQHIITGKKQKVLYSDILPVELTPEIITKCNFEQNKFFPHLQAYRHKKHLFNINVVGNIYEVSFGLIAQNMAIISQRGLYLHQLQNLYYALTNLELILDWEKQD